MRLSRIPCANPKRSHLDRRQSWDNSYMKGNQLQNFEEFWEYIFQRHIDYSCKIISKIFKNSKHLKKKKSIIKRKKERPVDLFDKYFSQFAFSKSNWKQMSISVILIIVCEINIFSKKFRKVSWNSWGADFIKNFRDRLCEKTQILKWGNALIPHYWFHSFDILKTLGTCIYFSEK